MKKYLAAIVSIVVVLIAPKIQVVAQDEIIEIVDTSDHTYTYTEMVEDLALLAQRYPDKIGITSIGTTADQRTIFQVVLGNPNAPKAVYIQSTIHAREWMNTMMVMKQLEMNLINWDVYGSLYQNCAVYIVPMVNPDGVTISQYGIDGIISPVLRANLANMKGSNNPRRWKANANGVDLNKNFSIGWDQIKNKVTAPASQDYRGIAPFTENEAIAMAQAMSQRQFEAIVSYHSYEGVIYWNVGETDELLYKNAVLATYLSNITGYSLGESSPVHGLEYNWSILELGIPTALIETGTTACPLPYSQWDSLWTRNKDVFSSLAILYK
jgi:g-D-glutamyl-meso-diaminopimelate peptidase